MAGVFLFYTKVGKSMGFLDIFKSETKTEERATDTSPVEEEVALDTVTLENWFSAGTITEDKVLKIPTALKCLNVLTQNIAKLPIYLAKENADGSVKKFPNDQRVQFLNAKNDDFNSGYRVKENLVRDYVLHGNSYTIADVNYVDGEWHLTYMEAVKHNRVTIQRFANKKTGRLQRANLRVLAHENGKAVNYKPFELIICANGEDGLSGKGVISYGATIFRKAIAEMEASTNFHERNGIPTGLLKVKTRLQPDEADRVKKGFKEKYQGASNGGEVILLQEGTDFVPLQPLTLDNTKERESIDEYICRLFNVPYSKIANKNGNNSKSLEVDNKAFLQECLSPIITVIEEALDYTLLSEDEKKAGYFFRFDVSEFERATQKENVETITTALQYGLMSFNEARAKLDLPPVKEDGFLHAPGTLIRDMKGNVKGQGLNETTPSANANSDNSKNEEEDANDET